MNKNLVFPTDLNEEVDANLNNEKPKTLIDDTIKERSSGDISRGLFLYSYRSSANAFILKGVSSHAFFDLVKAGNFKRRDKNDGSTMYIQDDNGIIEEKQPKDIASYIENIIKSIGDIKFSHKGRECNVCNAEMVECFNDRLQQFFSPIVAETNITKDNRPLLSSSKEFSIYPFLNGIVKITDNEIKVTPYESSKEGVMYKKDIKNKNFHLVPKSEAEQGEYAQFIRNVAGENVEQFKSVFGYALCGYRISSCMKAVVINDACDLDMSKPMGGTGKGIISKALKAVVPWEYENGKAVDATNKYLLSKYREGLGLFFFEDYGKNVNFEDFFSLITDGATIEAKYKNPYSLKWYELPVFVFTGNFPLRGSGTSSERRKVTLEVNNYYSKQSACGIDEPIVKEFGHRLFDDWSEDEWNRFYSYMFYCVLQYRQNGLSEAITSNVKENQLRRNVNEGFIDYADEILTDGAFRCWQVALDEYNDSEYKDTVNPISLKTFKEHLKDYAEVRCYSILTDRKKTVEAFI